MEFLMSFFPLILVGIAVSAIIKKQWGILKWMGICFLPTIICSLMLISNVWPNEAGLIGLLYLAMSLIGGTIVFFVGLALYALTILTPIEYSKRIFEQKQKECNLIKKPEEKWHVDMCHLCNIIKLPNQLFAEEHVAIGGNGYNFMFCNDCYINKRENCDEIINNAITTIIANRKK